MSDVWVKRRAGLIQDGKLRRAARQLRDDEAFRAWASEDGGQLSVAAVRHIVADALLQLMTVCRTQGRYEGDDGILSPADLEDVDEFAGVPGFGRAAEAVGWIMVDDRGEFVRLRNFAEHNPKSGAERMRKHREKRRAAADGKNGTKRKPIGGLRPPGPW